MLEAIAALGDGAPARGRRSSACAERGVTGAVAGIAATAIEAGWTRARAPAPAEAMMAVVRRPRRAGRTPCSSLLARAGRAAGRRLGPSRSQERLW